jgi:hypothetical protein
MGNRSPPQSATCEKTACALGMAREPRTFSSFSRAQPRLIPRDTMTLRQGTSTLVRFAVGHRCGEPSGNHACRIGVK